MKSDIIFNREEHKIPLIRSGVLRVDVKLCGNGGRGCILRISTTAKEAIATRSSTHHNWPFKPRAALH